MQGFIKLFIALFKYYLFSPPLKANLRRHQWPKAQKGSMCQGFFLEFHTDFISWFWKEPTDWLISCLSFSGCTYLFFLTHVFVIITADAHSFLDGLSFLNFVQPQQVGFCCYRSGSSEATAPEHRNRLLRIKAGKAAEEVSYRSNMTA